MRTGPESTCMFHYFWTCANKERNAKNVKKKCNYFIFSATFLLNPSDTTLIVSCCIINKWWSTEALHCGAVPILSAIAFAYMFSCIFLLENSTPCPTRFLLNKTLYLWCIYGFCLGLFIPLLCDIFQIPCWCGQMSLSANTAQVCYCRMCVSGEIAESVAFGFTRSTSPSATCSPLKAGFQSNAI